MENIFEFVKPELLILIPVLYLVGVGLKKAAFFADKYIPLALGAIGVIISGLWIAATGVFDDWHSVALMLFSALTQGILCAGCSVYANQIWKQLAKGKDE